MSANLGTIGYALAGLVFLLLSVLLVSSFRGRISGGLLAGACVVTSAWALLIALLPEFGQAKYLHIFVIEIVFDAAWLVFLSALFSGALGTSRLSIFRIGGPALAIGILIIGLVQGFLVNREPGADQSSDALVIGSLLTALYALVLIEQIYRNSREAQRNGLKFLCLALGSIFAFDLFLYSNAIIGGQVSDLFWSARGYVVAMTAPLIAIAARRSPSWSVRIFVSRQVVFYTATIFGAGIYLIVVGLIGYYVRSVGGEWGAIAQITIFAAAVIGLFIFLFSDTVRRRLRVFISKHFFANKYDYRQEWLRLIGTLTSQSEPLPLFKRAIKALAQIIESPGGALWLQDPTTQDYRCVSGWNVQLPEGELSNQDALPVFLQDTGWIIDFREYADDPTHYGNADLSSSMLKLPDATFVIPLFSGVSLLGFVVLECGRAIDILSFEDRDLLKTAGRQVASHLAQDLATEQLAESRQFEAFNRLTSYLMHDLKNLIAQQSLIVENARVHRDNPVFFDDVLDTIRSSVKRMRSVMQSIQQRPSERGMDRVELGQLVQDAVNQGSDRDPVPEVTIASDRAWVNAYYDQLLMALVHAIRNAQDATDSDGYVKVSLQVAENQCCIHIEDSGCGMDQKFIRDRLFKPFDSTKGTQGMGIGAYQIRETIRSLGGEVHVESNVGEGTTMFFEIQCLPENVDSDGGT